MGSFGLQNSCHLVWQRVVELVDEVVGDGTEGHLAGIPKLVQIHRLGSPSFLLHFSPDMLNDIHIWRLFWPSLKDLLEVCYPVEKSDRSCSWECTGRQESVDIWRSRSPWHLYLPVNCM